MGYHSLPNASKDALFVSRKHINITRPSPRVNNHLRRKHLQEQVINQEVTIKVPCYIDIIFVKRNTRLLLIGNSINTDQAELRVDRATAHRS